MRLRTVLHKPSFAVPAVKMKGIRLSCKNTHPMQSILWWRVVGVALLAVMEYRMDYYLVADAFVLASGSSSNIGHATRSFSSRKNAGSLLYKSASPEEDDDDKSNNESDSIDESSLNELSNRLTQQDPYERLFATNEWEMRPKPTEGHVIVFKQDTPDEGVHSIEYPLGSGQNSILAFESEPDCLQFATALREMEFFEPQVCFMDIFGAVCIDMGLVVLNAFASINEYPHSHYCVRHSKLYLSQPIKMDLRGLEQYCAEMDIRVQCVPAGFDLMPPSVRLVELNHNPDLRGDQEQVQALFDLDDSHQKSMEDGLDESNAFM